MTTQSIIRAATAATLAALTFLVACSDQAIAPSPAPTVHVVSVTPTSRSLILGQQTTLQATLRAANGDELDRPVTWTSEDENLATVTATGVVTALAVGEVSIRATSEGRMGRGVLTILPKPPVTVAEVRISADNEIELPWNGTTTVTATPLDADGNVIEGRTTHWMSSRPAVATISDGGQIVARSAGTAIITAVIDGVLSHANVRVLAAPVVDLTIEASTFGLEVGEILTISARITRADGTNFYAPTQWTSSAPGIVQVTHVDLWYAAIEALTAGEATLTATFEGKSASRTVRAQRSPTHDLIYTRWTGTAAEIFVLGLGVQGGAPPVKLNAGNVSREPSPSPDGTQFAFSVSQPQFGGGIQNDLYIVNRNGMNMRWLTRMPGIEDSPKWSPDGTKILFHGVVDDRADIYTINVDGTGLFNVTASTPAEMSNRREPAWSPDGSQVVFVGAVGGQHKLWVVNADGTNLRQLTTDAGFDMTPTWSPDGTHIAFVRYDAATPANGDDIMIVSASGGATTRYAMTGDQRSPAWSPDGGYIAFSGTALTGTGVQQLYTMRADGTGMRLRTVDPAWRGGANPAWITRQ